MDNRAYRVGCYLRVSTENQIENYSIAEQQDRLTSFCKAKDYNVYKFYIDPGYSGGNTERPALQQMLSDINFKKINMVIVYKLDRLSRSQKDTLTLIEDNFLANNVDFISVCENFDTSTPFGRAMIGILSVFAQLEKDQITERFTMGRIGRAKNGFYHGGSTIPLGYDYVDGKLIVNEYEAVQVRDVYNLFLSGKSIHAIQRIMKAKYPDSRLMWSAPAPIVYILKNSLYYGKVKFKGKEYVGEHQPILDKSTFDTVQQYFISEERENAKNSAQKTPYRAGYLLSSLIFCGNCGARYCANHGLYRCYSRSKSNKKFVKDPTCKNTHIDIQELDDFIKHQILTISYDKEKISKLVPQKAEQINVDALKKQLKDIDTQLSRLLDLYQIGSISSETIKTRADNLQSKKDNIEKQLLQNCNNTNTDAIDTFIKLLSTAQKVLSDPTQDIETQRLLVSSLISSIYIMPDDAIKINWRI